MTCDEFKALLNSRQPQDATRAEWTAAQRHFETCPACHALIEAVGSAMSPAEQAVVEAHLDLLLAPDDPEAVLPDDPNAGATP